MAEQQYALTKTQLDRIARAVKRIEQMPSGGSAGQRSTNFGTLLQVARATEQIKYQKKGKVQLMMPDPEQPPDDKNKDQEIEWIDTDDEPIYCAAGPLVTEGMAVAEGDNVWVGWTGGWLTVVQTMSCLVPAEDDDESGD